MPLADHVKVDAVEEGLVTFTVTGPGLPTSRDTAERPGTAELLATYKAACINDPVGMRFTSLDLKVRTIPSSLFCLPSTNLPTSRLDWPTPQTAALQRPPQRVARLWPASCVSNPLPRTPSL